MATTIEFALFAFTTLFTMINPLGVVPIYITMTTPLSEAQRLRVARKATLTASLTLIAFALTGQFIFDFFAISVDSLRVVGGVIFFLLGYEMLQARLSRMRMTEGETVSEYMNDISITPLAIPIICGPGAITSVILLMDDAQNASQIAALLSVVILILLLTYVILISGQRIMNFLGDSGNKVMMRLMGLIVMVIAVEFFFGGLTPIVRDMLMITE